MKRLFVLGGLPILALSLLSALPAHAATTCTGTLSGAVSGPVTVPAGQTCTLNGATVDSGGVQVGANATLNSTNSDINGNVLTNGGTLHLCGGTVTGFVQAINGPSAQFSTLTGNGSCSALTITGSVDMSRNLNGPAIHGANIGGTLTDGYNRHGTDVQNSTIGGSLIYNNNDQAGGFNAVVNNQVHGSITCANNTPGPVHSGNTAGGTVTGQCA